LSAEVQERDSEGFEIGSARFWTASNVVSLLRVVLVAPTIYYILAGEGYHWHVFGYVMLMVISDVLDGTLARARKEITEWGKIIDPLADKIAIDTISIVLWYDRGLPLWVVVAVLGRDLLILLGAALLASKVRVVPSANVWGKATTCVMAALLLSYGVDYHPPKVYLLLLAGVLIAASFISYAYRLRVLNRPGA